VTSHPREEIKEIKEFKQPLNLNNINPVQVKLIPSPLKINEKLHFSNIQMEKSSSEDC